MKANSPACYGALTLFASDSKKCTECPSGQDCETQVRQRLAALQERYNVNDLMHQHRTVRIRVPIGTQKATVNEDQEVPSVTPFDMKAVIQSEAKATVGIVTDVGGAAHVRDRISDGRNPFKSSHKGLYWCGVKLKSGTFTTDELTAHLTATSPHALAAKARAIGIVGALMVSKIVAKEGEVLSLSRP